MREREFIKASLPASAPRLFNFSTNRNFAKVKGGNCAEGGGGVQGERGFPPTTLRCAASNRSRDARVLLRRRCFWCCFWFERVARRHLLCAHVRLPGTLPLAPLRARRVSGASNDSGTHRLAHLTVYGTSHGWIAIPEVTLPNDLLPYVRCANPVCRYELYKIDRWASVNERQCQLLACGWGGRWEFRWSHSDNNCILFFCQGTERIH